jgi:hypothetical protein
MIMQEEVCDALVQSSPRLRSLLKHRPTTHQLRSVNEKAFASVTYELQESFGKRDSGFNVGRANSTDFRTDCALAARAVLSPRDFILWSNSFLNFTESEKRIPVEIAKHIRLTVGKEFARRELNNTKLYFGKAQS